MSKTAAYDLACEIADFADLLAILMAGPDAGTATDGARLVALEIGARADRIKEAVTRALWALYRLKLGRWSREIRRNHSCL